MRGTIVLVSSRIMTKSIFFSYKIIIIDKHSECKKLKIYKQKSYACVPLSYSGNGTQDLGNRTDYVTIGSWNNGTLILHRYIYKTDNKILFYEGHPS